MTLAPVTFGLLAYAAAGALFALWFVTRGAEQRDPAVRGSGLLFRLLILPGAIALWPWLLTGRRATRRPPAPTLHRIAWMALAALLPAAIALSVAGWRDATPPNHGMSWEKPR